MRRIFQGTLFTLLNPYGLFGGVLFVSMFLLHGCLWLMVKTEGSVQEKAAALVNRLWMALAVIAVGFLVATWYATRLYDNYLQNPLMYVVPIILIPVIVVGALVMVRVYLGKGQLVVRLVCFECPDCGGDPFWRGGALSRTCCRRVSIPLSA